MVVVSYSGKEINAKLVYYGAGLSGKTTNLESIYEAVPETSRGKMVSMKTQSDRTLFFDLLPLDLGEIMGYKTRFLVYTVPGQVFYNATRKLVLKGADAIVFVADSGVGKMEENKESLGNLRANLEDYGLRLEDIPFVLQYNKRDLPQIYTVEELNAELNPDGKIQIFEAVATQGIGVFETFRGVSHLLMQKVTRDIRRSPRGNASSRRLRAEDAAAPAAGGPALTAVPAHAAPIEPPADSNLPELSLNVDQALPLAPAQPMAGEARESEERDAVAAPALDSEPAAVPEHAEMPGACGAGADGPAGAGNSAWGELPLEGGGLGVARGEAAAPLTPATEFAAGGAVVAEAEERTLTLDTLPRPEEGGPQEVVVPVTLPRMATREIVLRIVIRSED